MRVEREVRIPATDMGQGMTVDELRATLSSVPGDIVPKVVVGLNGRIKRISFQIMVDTDV